QREAAARARPLVTRERGDDLEPNRIAERVQNGGELDLVARRVSDRFLESLFERRCFGVHRSPLSIVRRSSNICYCTTDIVQGPDGRETGWHARKHRTGWTWRPGCDCAPSAAASVALSQATSTSSRRGTVRPTTRAPAPPRAAVTCGRRRTRLDDARCA